jgi:hypothetical protein
MAKGNASLARLFGDGNPGVEISTGCLFNNSDKTLSGEWQRGHVPSSPTAEAEPRSYLYPGMYKIFLAVELVNPNDS